MVKKLHLKFWLTMLPKVKMTHSAMWTVGMEVGMHTASFSNLPYPLFSIPCLAITNVVLIIFQTATSLCMYFGQGLHTQRTVCLNLGQTRFTLLAVIMAQTAREGGYRHSTPSHSLTLSLYMTHDKITSPRAVPHRSVLPFVGVWAASLRLPCTFCSHRESRRGWLMGGEYDNTLQRKWAQCSGM